MKTLIAGTRRLALGLTMCLSALVAACGGGTQVKAFAPTRLVAFGDENSAFNASGKDVTAHNQRKYTINAYVGTTPALDCGTSPNWIQYLASSRGFVFDQCNGSLAPVTAFTYATAGGTVESIDAQIAAFGGYAAFRDGDLVTMYVGANDVVALYQQMLTGLAYDAAVARAGALGDELAAKVNAITDHGAKVLVLMIPDVGLTPYAALAEVAHPGSTQWLTDLSTRFNTRVGFSIIADGHIIALLKANDLLRNLRAGAGITNSLVDIADVACVTTRSDYVLDDLSTCDSGTLVTGVDPGTWLWADSFHFSPGGHAYLGSAAVTQVARNPF